MTADFGILLLCGVLSAGGVFLILDRTLLRVILGLMMLSNGINLLLIAMGGPPGNPPILGRGNIEGAGDVDTVVQALILTAIVITAGVVAFLLTLMYRSYQFTTDDEVEDDPEDTKVASRSPKDMSSAPDRDRSDDPLTGEPTELGDQLEYSDSIDDFDAQAKREAKEAKEDKNEGGTK